MSEIEDLREKRKVAWLALKSSHVFAKRARELHKSLEERFERDKKLYESLEYQIAILDGRKQIIPPGGSKERKSKVVTDLTEEQIMELAKRLGIVLLEVDSGDNEDEQAEETPDVG